MSKSLTITVALFLALIPGQNLFAQEGHPPQVGSTRSIDSHPQSRSPQTAKGHLQGPIQTIDKGRPVAPKNQLIEKIQVTGSRIKRLDLQGPSPVFVIDREAIEKSGYNSISDILREVTVNSFGGMREHQLGSVSGLAHANLRGLGPERTLVLLNGKRLAADAINRAVDLNLIPVAAIERVEILTNGGSALYGSDALGGVINMITRKDGSGTEISLQQTVTQLKGGEKTHAALTSRYANSQFNVMGLLSYRNNRRLMGNERSWTSHLISQRGSPGTLGKKIKDQQTTFQPAADCPSDRIDIKGNCTYNYSRHSTTRPQIKQLSGLLEIARHATSTQAYMRILGTRKMTHLQYPASFGDIEFPTTDFADLTDANGKRILDPSEISEDNNLIFRQRFVELGPRRVEITTDAYSALGGLKGEFSFTESWDWDFSINYNRVHRFDERVGGFILKDDLNKAIHSREYRPQAANGQRGELSPYQYNSPYQRDSSEVAQAELTLVGEVLDLSNGPIEMSFGVTASHELFKTRTDKATRTNLVLNKKGLNGHGDRNTLSSYVEFNIPLMASFEWQLAARYDNYNDFGQTFNPQTAFRWSPSNSWMIRGSAGTGFMAPRIQDLYSNKTEGWPKMIDHVLCREKGEQCAPSGIPILRRGNPKLTEEKSFHGGLGAAYQATSRLNFTLDSWYLILEDEIGSDWSAMTEAEARFGSDYVRRRGVDIQRDCKTCKITLIDAPWQNLFSKELIGLDISTTWEPHIKTGWLSLNLTHSHLFSYKEESFPGLGRKDKLGQFGKPAWKRQVSVTYSPQKNHQIFLGLRTVGPSEKQLGGTHRTYEEYDAQYKYTTSWEGRWTVGVRNFLGSTPPLDETTPQSQLNTSLYDNLGRYAYLGYNHRF